MNAPRRLFAWFTSYNLGPKLFFSHFVVALAGTLTFVAVTSVAAPAIFGNVGAVDPRWALLYVLLAAGATAAGVAIAASFFVARRIAKPVRRMLEATRRVSSGRYDERVPVIEDDEIGALSESFNAMAAALEEGERQRRQFVADVSHELRTPLSTLEGYVEGLLDGVASPNEETWGLMYAEAERIRRLVDDLQQLARAETGRLTIRIAPLQPERVVRLAVEGMQPLFAERGVELEKVVPADAPRAMGDAGRISQVLANLLSNALRHTPRGGRVVVEARDAGEEVVFAVRDTGAGITPEHLPRVFDRFYRVEGSRSRSGPSAGGSGLGLAISRALVEAMDGRIWAESGGPGRGATFAFGLPRAALIET